jgi:hypothetical protein
MRKPHTTKSLLAAIERLEHRLAETQFEVDAVKTAITELIAEARREAYELGRTAPA